MCGKSPALFSAVRWHHGADDFEEQPEQLDAIGQLLQQGRPEQRPLTLQTWIRRHQPCRPISRTTPTKLWRRAWKATLPQWRRTSRSENPGGIIHEGLRVGGARGPSFRQQRGRHLSGMRANSDVAIWVQCQLAAFYGVRGYRCRVPTLRSGGEHGGVSSTGGCSESTDEGRLAADTALVEEAALRHLLPVAVTPLRALQGRPVSNDEKNKKTQKGVTP